MGFQTGSLHFLKCLMWCWCILSYVTPLYKSVWLAVTETSPTDQTWKIPASFVYVYIYIYLFVFTNMAWWIPTLFSWNTEPHHQNLDILCWTRLSWCLRFWSWGCCPWSNAAHFEESFLAILSVDNPATPGMYDTTKSMGENLWTPTGKSLDVLHEQCSMFLRNVFFPLMTASSSSKDPQPWSGEILKKELVRHGDMIQKHKVQEVVVFPNFLGNAKASYIYICVKISSCREKWAKSKFTMLLRFLRQTWLGGLSLSFPYS